MTITYKTDDSFFTTVFPPFIYYGWIVKSWLSKNDTAKFRYIRDTEIEQEFWNIQQINDVYPEIKTIAIVVNPWARIRYAYSQLCIMKENNQLSSLDLDFLKLDSFSKFVNDLPNLPASAGNFWFTLTTPMCKWFDYAVDGESKTVDYILKDTSLESDFQLLQDYFSSNVPLDTPKKLPSYKRFYNKKTREIVAALFKEDIERFNYEF
tara:strand:- start:455 stop:1078 length:624 start_codon:yes stop_codon:yes gene_type:complete